VGSVGPDRDQASGDAGTLARGRDPELLQRGRTVIATKKFEHFRVEARTLVGVGQVLSVILLSMLKIHLDLRPLDAGLA